MQKSKLILCLMGLSVLFACTSTPNKKPQSARIGYLKNEISQAELNNPADYKRYYYYCRNFDTGEQTYLTVYFPLSRESRLKENFGFYVQLNGGKAYPFDHLENRTKNFRGSRFEVIYRSYFPIQGTYVDLIAREKSSTYYKNGIAWLDCREG